MYKLTLTREAQKFYDQADAPLVRRLNRCIEQLIKNPYEHPNIKRLRGPLSGYLRYRIGEWRVVYQVDDVHQAITVMLIIHRSKAY